MNHKTKTKKTTSWKNQNQTTQQMIWDRKDKAKDATIKETRRREFIANDTERKRKNIYGERDVNY